MQFQTNWKKQTRQAYVALLSKYVVLDNSVLDTKENEINERENSVDPRDQNEEKNSYVTEELILYVFLGIFIIYVLDSFVRVGKYTR